MIKKIIEKITCTLLTAAMLGGVSATALSYTGLGEVNSQKRDTVGGGLYYTELKSETEEEKKQHSYIFEYDYRKGGTLPVVRYGGGVYGKSRLGSLVSTETDNGKYVFGALNGDFYSMQTGVPMGIMIDDGKLLSSDDTKYALGFFEDGSAIIGKPSVEISITNLDRGGEAKKIHHLNKFPTIWGAYLVTEDFSSTTMSATESSEIIIELDGSIPASGSVTGVIRDVITDKNNIPIPEGCAVLTVSEEFDGYSDYTDLKKGDRIRIDTKCAELWELIVSAIGGGDLILDSGVMPEGIIDEDHEKTVNPRTAVGLKPDGNVVFFAVDGRTSSSRGLTLEDLATVMSELGCVYAMNLDGGGSTTVMVKPSGASETDYVNTPSDGTVRSVSNGILFLCATEPDGKPAALSVSPHVPLILRGSTVGFDTTVLDCAYLPIEAELAEGSLVTAFAEEYPDDAGSVHDCSFTAGMTAGEYLIKVTNGDISGAAYVTVADRIEDLKVSPEALQIKPGSRLDIAVEAIYDGSPIYCDSGSFYYTLNGAHDIPNAEDYPGIMLLSELGCLDENGNFISFGGEYEGEVEVGVWFDEFVRYVNIKISDESQIISELEAEDDLSVFEAVPHSGASALSAVSYGYRSSGALEIYVDFETDTQSKVFELKPSKKTVISPDAESIKLWFCGDLMQMIGASVSDTDGNVYELSYEVTKDYSKQLGWRELTAVIPESLRGQALTLDSVFSIHSVGNSSCKFVIDSPTIHFGRADEPFLSELDEHWAKAQLNTLYEMGVIQDFDCEVTDSSVYYSPDLALTRAEFAKMLVLFTGTNAFPFITEGAVLEADTPYDKVPYIRAALANGLMSGRGTLDDGTVIFDPNATITRQEAFKVIGSLIHASSAELTFADAADIADWAIDGISSCVGSGIVNGYADGTLRPASTISRSELAAVLIKMG